MSKHITIIPAFLMMLSLPVMAQEVNNTTMLSGTIAHVRDGNTIEVDGVAIRLSALDCPENGTRKGNQATKVAQQFQGSQTQCELTGAKT